MIVAFKDAAAIEQAVSFAADNVLRSGDTVTLLFIQVTWAPLFQLHPS